MEGRDQIQEIKDKLDIASVVREYVPSLKKTGRNHFGLCPFHQEKTPSFSVNPELGLYKCFGCGEGGDVINFIQKLENIDFPRALEISAKKAGVKLERKLSPRSKKLNAEKKRLIEANTIAAKFFKFILFEHSSGEAARQYVRGRKLRKQEVEKFKLGYAPEGFDNLKKVLIKKGFKESELIAWGLLATKNNKSYDKFRKRLMFPILNERGEVVGFSGRLIDKEDKGPKYLNSPETLVYKKSRLLYGLFQAKESLRKNNYVILVEGNIDILTSHGEGVENIVAPLGTALTEDQVSLMRRYSEEVYFALDTDEAGEKALIRGLELIEAGGIKAKALDIGDYQDVDELIVKGGDWKEVVRNAEPVIEHLFKRFKNKFDTTTAEGKSRYANELLKYIARLKDNIEIVHYLEKLSKTIGIAQSILESELKKYRRNEEGSQDQLTNLKEALVKSTSKNSFEKTIMTYVYNYKDWITTEEHDRLKSVITDGEFSQILEHVISGGKMDSKLISIYEEIGMNKVEVYDIEKEFHYDLKQLLDRYEQKLLSDELSDGDIDVEKLHELAQRKGRMSKNKYINY